MVQHFDDSNAGHIYHVDRMCVHGVDLAVPDWRCRLGIKDQEDFDHACMAVSEMLEYDIGRGAGFSSVKSLLDTNRMALKIEVGGETFFEYGNREDGDAALLSAAELLGGQPTLTLEERSLYVGSERVKGVDYTIYLFGNYHGRETYSELKVSLVLSAIVIAFTIFLSILLTNRFLTKLTIRGQDAGAGKKQEGVGGGHFS